MRKITLLFAFLFATFASSQEYHFDNKCFLKEEQIKGNYKGTKRTTIVYFNSQNDSYLAYDYFFLNPPRRSFWISDFQNHNFFSYSINLDSKLSSLRFIDKQPLKIYPDEREIERIDIEKLEENVFIIKTFQSEKSKKANLELKMKLEESDFPMQRIKFMDLTDNIHRKIYDELLLDLDSKNYRITDVVYNYKNGVIMHTDLSECEKINLKLLTEPKS